jgi:hypothetical protein
LWEWIETYRIVSRQLAAVKNSMIFDTKNISTEVSTLLDFAGGEELFDYRGAAQEAQKRADTVYDHAENERAIEYAWDLFGPRVEDITARIRSEFPDDPVIDRITS